MKYSYSILYLLDAMIDNILIWCLPLKHSILVKTITVWQLKLHIWLLLSVNLFTDAYPNKYWCWCEMPFCSLHSSQSGLEKQNLFLICPCLPLRLSLSHPDSIHIIVWTTSETRISLCCLHNFHALITKGHLFGPLVSRSFPCWGLREGVALDCGGWQSHIVWTAAASQRALCGERWPRKRGPGLG